METRRSCPDQNFPGYIRRRACRAKVFSALRELCKKIEKMQRSKDGRAACREVERLLGELQARDVEKERA